MLRFLTSPPLPGAFYVFTVRSDKKKNSEIHNVQISFTEVADQDEPTEQEDEEEGCIILTFDYNYEGAPEPLRIRIPYTETAESSLETEEWYSYPPQGKKYATESEAERGPAPEKYATESNAEKHATESEAERGLTPSAADSTEGVLFTEYPVPEREGYYFCGWYEKKDSSIWELPYSFGNERITEDRTFYAKWYNKRIGLADGEADSVYIEFYIAPVLRMLEMEAEAQDIRLTDDYDRDGLDLQEEYIYGTDPFRADTDGDGLTDSEELNVYRTDPKRSDTDGDGLTDGKEVLYGWNPEAFEDSNTFTTPFDEEKGIHASVSMTLSGEQAESLKIEKLTGSVLLPPDMPGYIDAAYDLEVDGGFESADLHISFEENLLSDPLFDPVIYYYDEEQQWLYPMDTTVEGNTASTRLSHFSTYILLNRREHDRAISGMWIDTYTETFAEGYERLEYITSSGKEYIDTGVSAPDGYRADVKFRFTRLKPYGEDYGNNAVLGNEIRYTDGLGAADIGVFNGSEGCLGAEFKNGVVVTKGAYFSRHETAETGKEYHAEVSFINGKESVSFNGEPAVQDKYSYVHADTTVGLFCTHSEVGFGGTNYNARSCIDMFYCRLYNSQEILVRDYVPARRISDGVCGMYDLVTKEFCTSGEGAFTGGPEAVTEGDPIEETDTDGDGIPDRYEEDMPLFNGKKMHLDKNNPDTDGDGLLDGEEIVIIRFIIKEEEGSITIMGRMLSDPTLADTDGDGIPDPEDPEELFNIGEIKEAETTWYDAIYTGIRSYMAGVQTYGEEIAGRLESTLYNEIVRLLELDESQLKEPATKNELMEKYGVLNISAFERGYEDGFVWAIADVAARYDDFAITY